MTRRLTVGHGKGQRRPRELRGRKGCGFLRGKSCGHPPDVALRVQGAGVWWAPGASLSCVASGLPLGVGRSSDWSPCGWIV